MKFLKISIVLTAIVIFAIACNQSATNTTTVNNSAIALPLVKPTPPAAAAPDDEAAMGKELYATNCMICHKDTGKGGRVTIKGKSINPEDLTKDKFKTATNEKLIGYVTNGVEDEGMPAFADKLTPEQIKSVINHVRTLQQ